MNHAICIDRQFGSGGRAVGKAVAKQLGCQFYDSALVNLAVQTGELSYKDAESGDEKAVNPWLYTPMTAGTFPDMVGTTGPEKMFRITSKLIEEIALKGDAVFVGRLADVVLEDTVGVDVLSIFIYGPEAYRIQRLIQTEGFTSKKEAVAAMKKKDKQRRNYYNYYTGREYGNPVNYDMCLDSSYLGIEKTADLIVQALKLKQQWP